MYSYQRAVLAFCVMAGTTLSSRSATAQYAAALPVGVTTRASQTMPAPESGAHGALTSIAAAESGRSPAVVQPPRHARRIWYWFTVGGAVAGAGTIVGMAATNCDQGCQDDGGWAYVPAYAAGGALVGAVTGTLIGLLVDAARRDHTTRANNP